MEALNCLIQLFYFETSLSFMNMMYIFIFYSINDWSFPLYILHSCISNRGFGGVTSWSYNRWITTTYTISVYHHYSCEFKSVTCDRSVVFPGPSVSSTNKTDRHDITEILLKVALNTITIISNKRVPYIFMSIYLYRVMVMVMVIFSYFVAVSFIGWRNQITWRKLPTCRKSLTSLIT